VEDHSFNFLTPPTSAHSFCTLSSLLPPVLLDSLLFPISLSTFSPKTYLSSQPPRYLPAYPFLPHSPSSHPPKYFSLLPSQTLLLHLFCTTLHVVYFNYLLAALLTFFIFPFIPPLTRPIFFLSLSRTNSRRIRTVLPRTCAKGVSV